MALLDRWQRDVCGGVTRGPITSTIEFYALMIGDRIVTAVHRPTLIDVRPIVDKTPAQHSGRENGV